MISKKKGFVFGTFGLGSNHQGCTVLCKMAKWLTSLETVCIYLHGISIFLNRITINRGEVWMGGTLQLHPPILEILIKSNLEKKF